MVNVLGCERSERGFESRRPEFRFSSTHQKSEEKSAVPRQRHPLQPLVTITPDEAQQLIQLSLHVQYNYNSWPPHYVYYTVFLIVSPSFSLTLEDSDYNCATEYRAHPRIFICFYSIQQY